MLLYIFECALRVITAMHGGSDKPLSTTGEPMTLVDGVIGVAVLFGCVVIIFAIALFFRNRRKKKSNALNKNKTINLNSEDKEHNSSESAEENKYAHRFIYLCECMLFGLFALHGGTNKIMKSTNEKPTWKEAIISLLSWLTIATIIVLVVLVCI